MSNLVLTKKRQATGMIPSTAVRNVQRGNQVRLLEPLAIAFANGSDDSLVLPAGTVGIVTQVNEAGFLRNGVWVRFEHEHDFIREGLLLEQQGKTWRLTSDRIYPIS